MEKQDKKKKFSKLVLILLLIVGWFGYLETKEVIGGEKMSPLARMLFSDRFYAKYIEVKSYYLTDVQVAEMVLHPEKEVKQLSQRELRGKEVSLVLRVKNKGGVCAWGTLLYSQNHHDWYSIKMFVSSPEKFYSYVIPDTWVFSPVDIPPMEIKVKWKNLYTK